MPTIGPTTNTLRSQVCVSVAEVHFNRRRQSRWEGISFSQVQTVGAGAGGRGLPEGGTCAWGRRFARSQFLDDVEKLSFRRCTSWIRPILVRFDGTTGSECAPKSEPVVPIPKVINGSVLTECIPNSGGCTGPKNSRKPQKGQDLTLIPLNPEEEPASVGWLER